MPRSGIGQDVIGRVVVMVVALQSKVTRQAARHGERQSAQDAILCEFRPPFQIRVQLALNSRMAVARVGRVFACETSGQSYKASTIVIYDSRGKPDLKIPPNYDSRLVNYEHKLFIRLATGICGSNPNAAVNFEVGDFY